jgi:hypothetical protein
MEILEWIIRAQKAIEEDGKRALFPKGKYNVLDFTKGPKYFHLFLKEVGDNRGSESYCMIDYDGNIYKCKTWAKPAPKVRATINSVDPDKLTESKAWLYFRL